MGANTSLFLANDTKSFEDRYGFIPFDEFTRSLSNESEKILLLDGYGNTIDEVTYSDSSPWPLEPDGSGPFLVLKGFELDNNEGVNWESAFNLPANVSALGRLNISKPLVSIFPNPSRDRLYIHSNGKVKQVNIWNVGGKRLGQYIFKSEEVELDFNSFKRGTYHIEIKTDKGQYLRKVIKN